MEDSTDAASLRSLSAFAPDRASRLVWREHLEPIVLRDGEVLFRQGEPADSMFFIEEGELAVVLEVAGASRSHVRTFGAGQCLGEMAFYRHLRRSATVEAAGPARLWRLTTANLTRCEQQHPRLALAFHRHVASLLGERVSFSNVEWKEPLARFAHALRGLAASDFSGAGWDRSGVAAVATRGDEVGEVAQAMEFLVARLQEHIAALRRETAAREAIESELRIAGEIQLSLLPPALSPEERRRVDFAAFIDPAREAGGDLYDGFFMPDGRFFTLVGDVSGKGVSAAVFMALAAMAVRTLARKVGDPGELLTQVNRLLCERNDTMQFVTACAAMLDPASGELTWANAGHPLAAVVSATGGIDWLDGPRAAPLGVFEGTVCQTQHRVLGEGDTLLVYSDGVSESMNAESVVFGSGGMVRCLSGATESDCASTVARVVAAVTAHQGEAEQADDITLVALRRATQSSAA